MKGMMGCDARVDIHAADRVLDHWAFDRWAVRAWAVRPMPFWRRMAVAAGVMAGRRRGDSRQRGATTRVVTGGRTGVCNRGGLVAMAAALIGMLCMAVPAVMAVRVPVVHGCLPLVNRQIPPSGINGA